jgi:hypothetical protein
MTSIKNHQKLKKRSKKLQDFYSCMDKVAHLANPQGEVDLAIQHARCAIT